MTAQQAEQAGTRQAGTRRAGAGSAAARASDALAFEWIKLRSIRSYAWTLAIAAVVTIGLTAFLAHTISVSPSLPAGGPLSPLTISFLAYAEYGVLPVSILGVLAFTSEYATGLIRTTFTAVPRRWAVVAAKAAVLGAATLLAGEILAFGSFWLTQAILAAHHRGISLTHPGAVRAAACAGLLMSVCAVTGLGLGAIIRHTAGAIAATVAVTYLLAALSLSLPSPWKADVGRFTLAFAAYQLVTSHPQAGLFSPPVSLLILLAWPVLSLIVAVIVVSRRDA